MLVGVDTNATAHVEVGGQPVQAGSLLPSRGPRAGSKPEAGALTCTAVVLPLRKQRGSHELGASVSYTAKLFPHV